MRIVITGASGNVGTALLLRLGGGEQGGSSNTLRTGHELVGLSRRRPPDAPPYNWASWVTADLSDPAVGPRLDDAFAGADAVVHLAWAIQPSHDRELLRRTNQDGSLAVAQAAQRAGVRHLVHMSSIGAYAPAPNRRVTETWPTDGVSSSYYSVDKSAAERALDGFESDLAIARIRPALIFQEAAASEIARYFLGPLVPTGLVRAGTMRFTPLPRRLAVQVVHAEDVAAAIDCVLEKRATGAFNVAAEPPIDRRVIRQLFGGVGPPLPAGALRVAADLSWRLRLQPTDPGWLDLAMSVPLLDTARLQALGWRPQRLGTRVIGDFVAALSRGAGRPGPLLRRRRHARPGPDRGMRKE